MDSFTIKDLEHLTGIKAHTIRAWEQRYHFLTPGRTKSNIRFYDASELKMLLNVALLNKNGFRISKISKMSREEIREKVLELSHAQVCEDRFVNDMIKAMVDLDVTGFENIIDNYILTKGVNKTVLQLLFPFLEKTDILWATDCVDLARERVASNIIRQKLIVAIDGSFSHSPRPARFLLFLPKGETHELGLLYVYYLLRSRGFEVIYLGGNMPLEQAAAILAQRKVDYVFMHLVKAVGNDKKFIDEMVTLFTRIPILISGAATERFAQLQLPRQIELITSLEATLQMINEL